MVSLIPVLSLSKGTTVDAFLKDVGLPLGRLGRPDDVADAIVFLASDRAGFITGAALGVDGGVVPTI